MQLASFNKAMHQCKSAFDADKKTNSVYLVEQVLSLLRFSWKLKLLSGGPNAVSVENYEEVRIHLDSFSEALHLSKSAFDVGKNCI